MPSGRAPVAQRLLQQLNRNRGSKVTSLAAWRDAKAVVSDAKGRTPASTPGGAPVVRKGRSAKRKAAEPSDNAKDSAAFSGSGRQDLNLRPLGPEPSALPG